MIGFVRRHGNHRFIAHLAHSKQRLPFGGGWRAKETVIQEAFPLFIHQAQVESACEGQLPVIPVGAGHAVQTIIGGQPGQVFLGVVLMHQGAIGAGVHQPVILVKAAVFEQIFPGGVGIQRPGLG